MEPEKAGNESMHTPRHENTKRERRRETRKEKKKNKQARENIAARKGYVEKRAYNSRIQGRLARGLRPNKWRHRHQHRHLDHYTLKRNAGLGYDVRERELQYRLRRSFNLLCRVSTAWVNRGCATYCAAVSEYQFAYINPCSHHTTIYMTVPGIIFFPALLQWRKAASPACLLITPPSRILSRWEADCSVTPHSYDPPFLCSLFFHNYFEGRMMITSTTSGRKWGIE